MLEFFTNPLENASNALTLIAAISGCCLIFLGVKKFIRHLKQQAETKRKLKNEQEKKVATLHKEEARKKRLKEKDNEVDPILKELLVAEIKLRKLFAKMDFSNIKEDDIVLVKKWSLEQKNVMDFSAFQNILEQFISYNESENFYPKNNILELFEQNFSRESCLHYADEKLGIDRGFYLRDGYHTGGVKFERGNGKYEDVHIRIERILRKLPGTDRGYVYILTNESFPNYLKIGKTNRKPEDRARELSVLTGVPTPYKVAFSILVGKCGLAESNAHKKLSANRVSNNREFFSIALSDAIRIIETIVFEIDQDEL